MQTPSKQPESSSMTHEEEEEILHDISKLQDQVQQISLSQRVTKNELEAMMSVNMDGLEPKIKVDMKGLKDGLKADMEGLREGLTKLLR